MAKAAKVAVGMLRIEKEGIGKRMIGNAENPPEKGETLLKRRRKGAAEVGVGPLRIRKKVAGAERDPLRRRRNAVGAAEDHLKRKKNEVGVDSVLLSTKKDIAGAGGGPLRIRKDAAGAGVGGGPPEKQRPRGKLPRRRKRSPRKRSAAEADGGAPKGKRQRKEPPRKRKTPPRRSERITKKYPRIRKNAAARLLKRRVKVAEMRFRCCKRLWVGGVLALSALGHLSATTHFYEGWIMRNILHDGIQH